MINDVPEDVITVRCCNCRRDLWAPTSYGDPKLYGGGLLSPSEIRRVTRNLAKFHLRHDGRPYCFVCANNLGLTKTNGHVRETRRFYGARTD